MTTAARKGEFKPLRFWLLTTGLAASLILLSWAKAGSWVSWLGVVTSESSKSEVYDAANALFTGLALAGVVATLLLQMYELKNQLEEASDARTEQQEQSRLLVMTAYLNALAAIHETRARRDLNVDQEDALEKIESVTAVLHERVLEFVVGLAEVSSRGHRIAKRLRELIAPVQEAVHPSGKNGPEANNFEALTDKLTPSSDSFENLAKSITDSSLMPDVNRIRKVFASVSAASVKQQRGSVTKAKGQEDHFKRFLSDCDELLAAVNQLCSRLEQPQSKSL